MTTVTGVSAVVDTRLALADHYIAIDPDVQFANDYMVTVIWTRSAVFGNGFARAYKINGTAPEGLEVTNTTTESGLVHAIIHTIKIELPIDEEGEATHRIPPGAGHIYNREDINAPEQQSTVRTRFDTLLPKPTITPIPNLIFAESVEIPVSWNVPIQSFTRENITVTWNNTDNPDNPNTSLDGQDELIFDTEGSTSAIMKLTFPTRHVGSVTITIDAATLENGGAIKDGLEDGIMGGVQRSASIMPSRKGPKAAHSVTFQYDTMTEQIISEYPVVDLQISNPSITLTSSQKEIRPFYLEDDYGRLSERAFAALVDDDYTTYKEGKSHTDAVIRVREYLAGHITYDNRPGSPTFLQYFRAKQDTGGVGLDNVAAMPAVLTDTDFWEMIERSYTNRNEFIKILFKWESANLAFKEVDNFLINDLQIRQYTKDGSILETGGILITNIHKLYRINAQGGLVARNQKTFKKWERLNNPPLNRRVEQSFETNIDKVIDNEHEILLELPSRLEGIFEVRVGSQEGQLPGEDGVDIVRAAKDKRHPDSFPNDSPSYTVTSGPIHFNTIKKVTRINGIPDVTTVQGDFFCIDRLVTQNEMHDNTLIGSTDAPFSEDYHIDTLNLVMTSTTTKDSTRGGGFVTVSDMVQKGSHIYFVVQLQRPGIGENALSDSIKATAALCHISIPAARSMSTVTEMRVLKKYVQVDEGPRSLTLHEGKVYFFEGTHYIDTFFSGIGNERLNDRFDDLYNDYVPGNLYEIDDSRAVDEMTNDQIELVYKAGSWQSDVTITKDLANEFNANERYLNHGGTASPLVSTSPDDPNDTAELNMITGGASLNKLIDYNKVERIRIDGSKKIENTMVLEAQDLSADINNWNWIRFSRFIEQRLPYLQTNKQKPFDIIKELAYLTHSIIGYQSIIREDVVTNVFFMKPRDPNIAYLKNTIVDDDKMEIFYNGQNRSFENIDDGSGIMLIDNELFRYGSIDDTTKKFQFFEQPGQIIGRGYKNTSKVLHRVNSKITIIDHILDLEESVIEPPIHDLKYRDDSTQLYNQVEIKYGTDNELIYRKEDPESVKENGELETSFDVPLDRHQLPWVKYLADQFLERNKDMKYMVTLVLKPTFFMKLGQTVLLRQKWRDKSRDGWHIFVATQVYDISHSFEDNTTTCIFRTI